MARPETRIFARFWPVWLASLIGLWPLATSLEARIFKAGAAVPGMAPDVILMVSLIQTALLLALAAGLGAALAHRVGLTSHLAERRGFTEFVGEVPQAVVWGVLLGVMLLSLERGLFARLSPSSGASAWQIEGSAEQALWLGMLYGGISEEVLMRWGVMSLACVAVMRVSGLRQGRMPSWIAWIGILISAVVFALGHLPAALPDGPQAPFDGLRILVLNTLAGLVFGALYWRRSLEAAWVAHAVVHLCFYGARGLGWLAV